jgi:hypothetical protein
LHEARVGHLPDWFILKTQHMASLQNSTPPSLNTQYLGNCQSIGLEVETHPKDESLVRVRSDATYGLNTANYQKRFSKLPNFGCGEALEIGS